LDPNRTLVLFGEVSEKDDSIWTIKPRPEVGGVREILFRFYQRDQATAPPADIDLVLSSPWDISVAKLEALFGGSIHWVPDGPAIGRNRTVYIERPAKQNRLEGVVSFELDKRIRDKKTQELQIVQLRFRRLD
jgi:hypothetical protein